MFISSQTPESSQPTVSQSVSQCISIQGESFRIADAPMYVYPTRLISAWSPQIMQVYLPETWANVSQITISATSGISHLWFEGQNFKHVIRRHITRRLSQQFSTPIAISDSYLYDNRHDTDANIAHVLTNAATRVLIAQTYFPDLPITIVLRRKATIMAKRAFEQLNIPLLCTDQAVQGKLLHFSENFQGAYEWNYPVLFGQRSFPGYTQETPERVFIARKGARALLNEAEVEQLLSQYGFVKFYYEDIPLHQQWSIARNAKVVAAIHGAALGNLVFNTNGVKLIEFFHPGYVVDMYRVLANAIGGSWCGVIGQIRPEVVRDLDLKQQARKFAAERTLIDLDCLHLALENLKIDK